MADQNVDPTFEDNVVRPGRIYSDKQLRALAMAIERNEVFGSWVLRKGEENLWPMIWMPLAFMKPEDLEDLKRREIVHVFSYMKDHRTMRAINGYPMGFGEMNLLTKLDFEKLADLHEELRTRLGAFSHG